MTTEETDPKKAAEQQSSNLPSQYVYAPEDQGAGLENTSAAEMALPFLQVLQSNSPECDKSDPKYVDGAAVPMLLNSATKQLYDGEKGVIFVPCARREVYVEYKPRQGGRGGGFVDIHDPNSELVKKAIAESKDFGKYKAPNGNELVQTREVYGYTLEKLDDEVPAERLVLSFQSTKLNAYKRQFMPIVSTMRGNPPLYAFRLVVRSAPDKNAKGAFRNYGIKPAMGNPRDCLIPATSPLILVGREINKAVVEGLMKADHSAHTADTTEGGEGSNDKVFG